MPRRMRHKRNTFAIARTLDDDGWQAYVEDGRGSLHPVRQGHNFFFTDEVTRSLEMDTLSSAKAAQAYFKTLLKPYYLKKVCLPIRWGKKHVDRYWSEKSGSYPLPT